MPPLPLIASLRKQTKPTSNLPPLAVSLQETARLTANGLSRIYKLIRAGELEAYQDGRARRVVMESIVAYVARRRAASAKKRQQLNSRPPRRQQPAKAASPPKYRARTDQPYVE